MLKTLAKDREERYQTAKDLVIDLKRLKQRLDVEAEIERTPLGPTFPRALAPYRPAAVVKTLATVGLGKQNGEN